MKKTFAIRILEFDAGHRVTGHETKCGTFHGHRYKAEIYCEAACLDGLGRVIDFSKIKEVLGNWIDINWDHAMIIFRKDPDLDKIQACTGYKPVFVLDDNPTAENMAAYLVNKGNDLMRQYNIKVTKIRLWETPNCYVEVLCEDI